MKKKIFSLILVLCFVFAGSLLLCACSNPFNSKSKSGMQRMSYGDYCQETTITE